MPTLRAPAVAGFFYPADPTELRRQVQHFLNQAAAASHGAATVPPKAMIVPHAGYLYSGAIAASAYVQLHPVREQITRVVLIGPSHRVGFRGLAVSTATAFATPLGSVALDQAAIKMLRRLPEVSLLEAAHLREHSLEVHLPFLQEVLGAFELIPLVAGEARPAEVGAVLEAVWGGPETLIVISSDLSHYQDYQTAQQWDRATSQAIENLRYEQINYDHACGRIPVNGLLWVARRKGLLGQTLDVRNSGDTVGSRDQVVGYGAYVFH